MPTCSSGSHSAPFNKQDALVCFLDSYHACSKDDGHIISRMPANLHHGPTSYEEPLTLTLTLS